jgi:hypothetical protein
MAFTHIPNLAVYIVKNMAIARQRFSNTRTHGSEQKRNSIVSQRLAKHTFPWQRIKQNNAQTVGDGDLYSVRLDFSLVQESSVASDSSLGIREKL